MTKAKARARAKARAAQKGKKRKANADTPGQQFGSGKFNPDTLSLKSQRSGANSKTFGAARRGSARSG